MKLIAKILDSVFRKDSYKLRVGLYYILFYLVGICCSIYGIIGVKDVILYGAVIVGFLLILLSLFIYIYTKRIFKKVYCNGGCGSFFYTQNEYFTKCPYCGMAFIPDTVIHLDKLTAKKKKP